VREALGALFAIAGLAYILRLAITGRKSIGVHTVKAKSESSSDSTFGTDSACALAVCSLAEVGLEYGHRHLPLTGSVIAAIGFLILFGTVRAPDVTVRILGVAGLTAFLAAVSRPAPSGAAVLLVSVAASFLGGCRLLRRLSG
jgi:hypothetical protein